MKKSIGPKTILYPAPVLIVGTYDKEGKPNAMTAAWGGICSSKPPCVTVSLRKATYTYGNILEQKAYTLNIPSERHVKVADYFGMVSGKGVDKFSETGLTPVRSELVNAPYIEDFPIILECRLLHTFEIGLHTQFIGEIMDVKADSDLLREDGVPDIEKVKPIVFAPGAHSYFGTGDFLGTAFSIGNEIKSGV
ncbi:MAG: flavin reductase family protein [Deltaproteobacteria bacterium]|nr:flavin reductase family protein [Deltaproteobacteria bacterium]